MQNLLLQPSAIPTGMAVLMVLAIVQAVRSRSRPGAGQRPLRPAQTMAALGFGVLAVLAGSLATMVDAGWLGRDPYRIAVMPASCVVFGCGVGALASLYSSSPPTSSQPPGHSNLGSLLQIAGLLLAFGMVACSGPFLLAVLS